MKRKPKYLLPERNKNGKYIWRHVEAKKSKIGGLGLFAKVDIPKDVFLPYIGMVVSNELNNYIEEISQNHTQRWKYLAERETDNYYTDGYPGFRPYKHFGCDGLSAAALMNEPAPGGNPNLKAYLDYYKTERKIQKGEELLICYGPAYEFTFRQCKTCRQKPYATLPKDLEEPLSLNTLLKLADIQQPKSISKKDVLIWLQIK
jgi:SET domain-containing protein